MTNANKSGLCGLLLSASLLTLVSPVAALAQASAPALYDVKELQVQHGRIGNPKASANCGTSSGEVSMMVLKALQADKLPAFSVLNAPKQNPNVARIDIYPDVVTLQPREKECISWVSISAQSREILQINPIATPRNLMSTYWQGGMMVGSNVTAHANTINDAFAKLGAQFSRQYRLDQPPELTPHQAAPQIPR